MNSSPLLTNITQDQGSLAITPAAEITSEEKSVAEATENRSPETNTSVGIIQDNKSKQETFGTAEGTHSEQVVSKDVVHCVSDKAGDADVKGNETLPGE